MFPLHPLKSLHVKHGGGKVDFRELNLDSLDIPMMENGVNSRLNAKKMCFFSFFPHFFYVKHPHLKKTLHTHTHTLFTKKCVDLSPWLQVGEVIIAGAQVPLISIFSFSLKLTASSPLKIDI